MANGHAYDTKESKDKYEENKPAFEPKVYIYGSPSVNNLSIFDSQG